MNQLFTLTDSQELVYSQIIEHLKKKNVDVIQVMGPAGTGKTTLIGHLMNWFKQEELSFWLTAPTGSAAYNLYKRVGTKVSTLHSQLYEYKGITENEAYEDEYTLNFDIKSSTSRPDIILVDEASLVGDQEQMEGFLRFGTGKLLTDLIRFCTSFQQRPLLVFVGDPFQISPSGLEQDPCLSETYWQKHFALKVTQVSLTEIKRQSDPFILSTLNYLREKVSNKVESAFRWIDDGPKGVSSSDVADVIVRENALRESFANVIIAYTNKKVAHYNRAIREAYQFDDVLCAGDLLLNIRSVYLPEGDAITNGVVLKVEQVNSISESRTYEVVGKNGKKEQVELRFRGALIKPLFTDNEPSLQVKLLENALDLEQSSIDFVVWKALFKDFLVRHYELLKRKPSKKNQAVAYKLWLIEFSEELRKDSYFNALIAKYAYAITGHRAQGHEWQSVYVDVEYKNRIHSIEGLRWLYTSCSRTRDKLLFINKEQTGFLAN